MAYPPRQYIEGYWYHVYTRSVDEVCLFEFDVERVWFVKKLDEVLSRNQCSLGALCLMDTHCHALVQMGPVALDRALNGLHNGYTKHINALRNRSGTLFDARPGANIILNDQYLLQLVPYIHQNPVKASMVESASKYEWNTDALYRGTEPPREEIEFQSWKFPPHFQREDRARIYQQPMGETVEESENRNGYYGSETDWETLERRKEHRSGPHRERRSRRTMEEIAGKLADEYGMNVDELKAPGRSQPETRIRQEAMVAMYEEGYGPTGIGDCFNRNKGTVVHAVKKLREESY